MPGLAPEAPTIPPPPAQASIWDHDSGLSEKVRKACEIARGDGYRYIWVDSSCIDKTSSSELSEAINSMFNWYRDAQICYAFLADVPSDALMSTSEPSDKLGRAPEPVDELGEASELSDELETVSESYSKSVPPQTVLAGSRWFGRSWTLQELIAPRTVVFLSKDWKGLGTKDSLADVVEAITHIDRDILTHKKALADESVAERMRWAAEREATRVEDEAYSLLGIFGITMPTLYGEGRHAFQRLQEEILQRIPDRTLFAWGYCDVIPSNANSIKAKHGATSPFASSPRSFRELEGRISRLSQDDFDTLGLQAEEYALTPHGVHAKLSFIPLMAVAPKLSIACHDLEKITTCSWHLVLLGSQQHADRRRLLGKVCSIARINGDIELLHVIKPIEPSYTRIRSPFGPSLDDTSPIFVISPKHLMDAHHLVELRSVYLPYPTSSIAERVPPPAPLQVHLRTLSVSFSPWAGNVLPPGYTVSELRPIARHPHDLCSLIVRPRDKSFHIHIRFRHMHGLPSTLIEARIWIIPSSGSDSENVQTDTLHSGPPYASAIWFASGEASPPLTQRNIHLATQSGNEMAL